VVKSGFSSPKVIQAFSEDAEVAQALETDVKTAADLY